MKAAVIVLNTNELEHLKTCLPSLMAQSYGDFSVFVSDNGSTDGSVEYVKSNFPGVKVVRNVGNVGFAEGNNQGAMEALLHESDYIVFLNPDTEVDRDWLSELVRASEGRLIGGATSKALLFNDRKRLDSGGGAMNFLGYGWSRGYNDIDRGQFKKGRTPFVCGGYCLFKRDVLVRVGIFDSDYFIYGEDTDLSWRVRLAGYDLVFAPKSIVYHKYAPNFNKKKLYLLERNRICTLLKNYSKKSLLILMPGILINEAAVIAYSLRSGWFYEKISGYLWNLRNLKRTMRKRKRVQRMRQVSDRYIVSQYVGTLSFAGFKNNAVDKYLNPILSAFWRSARKLI